MICKWKILDSNEDFLSYRSCLFSQARVHMSCNISQIIFEIFLLTINSFEEEENYFSVSFRNQGILHKDNMDRKPMVFYIFYPFKTICFSEVSRLFLNLVFP